MTSRTILHILHSLLDLLLSAVLLLSAAYSAYALWDNRQVYSAAENVREELRKLKPEAEEEGGASFAQLLETNAEVCAWLTLEQTRIDDPVVQGSDNLRYLNTDVYGNFALAGSIYLDARNERDFSDSFSLLYGHHMEKGRMFGDLDLYKDEAFFSRNGAGTLILPEGSYALRVFAVLLVPASETLIFAPKQTEIAALLDYASAHALYLKAEEAERIAAAEAPQILGLSTCSAEYTDARTVVLARMERIEGSKEGGSR